MMGLLRHLVVFVVGLVTGRKILSERARRARKALRKHEKLPFWLYGWKGFLKRLAFVLPFLVIGGFLLAASGVMPIKASSGHFAITVWFLEFSMSRSVATHSIGIQAPPLDSEALVVKGAGHYETGCRPCHGGVGDDHPQIPRMMAPHTPKLPAMVPRWDADELFYIAKHGVKFTGMPAFPSLERDDEVWAVVAFLLRMPEMDVPEYQRLVYGDALEGRGTRPAAQADAAGITGLPTGSEPVLVQESCRRCHGEGGSGRESSAFPRLAGQRADYVYAALLAYANGERHSGMMQPIAEGMTAEEMREIAMYYAQAEVEPRLWSDADAGTMMGGGAEPDTAGASPENDTTAAAGADTAESPAQVAPARTPGIETRRAGSGRLDTLIEPRTWSQAAEIDDDLPEELDRGLPASIERGRAIASRGITDRKIPACQDCHGPNRVRKNPFYPVLAGQFAEYLVLQLELFKADLRGGSQYAHLMRPTAEKLTKDEMRDVALYYESLGGVVTELESYVESLVPTEH